MRNIPIDIRLCVLCICVYPTCIVYKRTKDDGCQAKPGAITYNSRNFLFHTRERGGDLSSVRYNLFDRVWQAKSRARHLIFGSRAVFATHYQFQSRFSKTSENTYDVFVGSARFVNGSAACLLNARVWRENSWTFCNCNATSIFIQVTLCNFFYKRIRQASIVWSIASKAVPAH